MLIFCDSQVPGQNSWADEPSNAAIIRSVDSNHQHGEKRSRVEEESDDMEIQVLLFLVLFSMTDRTYLCTLISDFG